MFVQSCPADQARLRSHLGPCSSPVLHGSPAGVGVQGGTAPLSNSGFGESATSPGRHTCWTCLAGTVQRAPAQAGCGHGQEDQGEPWPGCAERPSCAMEHHITRCECGCCRTCHRVLASGLPLNQGAQLAVHITLECALTADGMATLGAARSVGVVLLRARGDKERKYAELLHSERCQLIVVGLETGGRGSGEALEFICQLAGSRRWKAPPILRWSAFHGWLRRWTRMLSISCARAFASSLVCARPRY